MSYVWYGFLHQPESGTTKVQKKMPQKYHDHYLHKRKNSDSKTKFAHEDVAMVDDSTKVDVDWNNCAFLHNTCAKKAFERWMFSPENIAKYILARMSATFVKND